MSTMRKLSVALAPLALVALSACATPFQANVQRFQQMPVPQGQTFSVSSDDPELARGIEFQRYADLVSQKMAALGYRPAASGSGELAVKLAYTIDKGRERVRSEPYFYQPYDPFYGPYWGPRSYGRSYMWGWYDPFAWGPGYDRVSSYTIYTSDLSMKIELASDKYRLFEGCAQAVSRDNDLTYLVPNLIDAMFTGFPGNSGETVRISVAPKKS